MPLAAEGCLFSIVEPGHQLVVLPVGPNFMISLFFTGPRIANRRWQIMAQECLAGGGQAIGDATGISQPSGAEADLSN